MNNPVKKLLPLALALAFLAPGALPEARAMDPVTIAILAPLAIKGAKIAAPYVVRGFICGCKHLGKMCIDVGKILNLPLGLCQMTIGAPFGYAKIGANNCWYGIQAPFKLAWDSMMLPIAFVGIDPPG